MSHVYCCSDLHGQYKLWEQIKKMVCADNSICYILGDCADRGVDGYKILNEVLADPEHFILLYGNHEDLFVNVMTHPNMDNIYCHCMNGGEPTINAWLDDGASKEFAEKLMALPLYKTYVNAQEQQIILTHAGFTPDSNLTIPKDKNEIIWNREHFHDEWDNGLSNTIIVHGHTPVTALLSYGFNDVPYDYDDIYPYFYCKDNNGQFHKVDIDCCSAFTRCTVLLDLDTWEYTTIKEGDAFIND